ncbi:hypothetical protein [Robbsia betulipollinis]|nr:hypothetical protein [Robbsia betulipollinis]
MKTPLQPNRTGLALSSTDTWNREIGINAGRRRAFSEEKLLLTLPDIDRV